jgi:hypothetical protein
VPKAETDPTKRCEVVSGWPAASKKMQRMAAERRPLEADCPKYSDIDSDDEVFERDWDGAQIRAMETKLKPKRLDSARQTRHACVASRRRL